MVNERKRPRVNEHDTNLLAILETQGPRLHGLLLKLTLSQDAAEELMQDLFLNLCRSDGFARADNSAAYVYRCAVHLAFSWRRTRKHTPPLSLIDEPAIGEPSPLTRLVRSEEIETVLDAVHQLGEPARDILVLRYIQEESYETIAAMVGGTPHQARAICHKALTRLRDRLNRLIPVTKTQENSHVTD